MVSPAGAPRRDTNQDPQILGGSNSPTPNIPSEHIKTPFYNDLPQDFFPTPRRIYPLEWFSALPMTWVAQPPPGWTPIHEVVSDNLVPENVNRIIGMIEGLGGPNPELFVERSKYLLLVLGIKLSNMQMWDDLTSCAEILLSQPGATHSDLSTLLDLVARGCRNEMSLSTCSSLIKQISEYHKPLLAVERLKLLHALVNSFLPPLNINTPEISEHLACARKAWEKVATPSKGTTLFGINSFSQAIKIINAESKRIDRRDSVTPFAPSDWKAFENLIRVGRSICGPTPSKTTDLLDYRLIDGATVDTILAAAFRNEPRLLAQGRLVGISYATSLIGSVKSEILGLSNPSIKDRYRLLHRRTFDNARERLLERSIIARHLSVPISYLPLGVGRMPVEVAATFTKMLENSLGQPKTLFKNRAVQIAETLQLVQEKIPERFHPETFELLIHINKVIKDPDQIAPPLVNYLAGYLEKHDKFPTVSTKRLPSILKVAQENGAQLPIFFRTAVTFAESPFELSRILALTDEVAVDPLLQAPPSSKPYHSEKPERERQNLLIETYLEILKRRLPLKENAKVLQTIASLTSSLKSARDLMSMTIQEIDEGVTFQTNGAPFKNYIEQVLPIVKVADLFSLHKRLSRLAHIPASLLPGYPAPAAVARELSTALSPLRLGNNGEIVSERAISEWDELATAWFRDAIDYTSLAKKIPDFISIAANFESAKTALSFAKAAPRSDEFFDLVSNLRYRHSADTYWPTPNTDTKTFETPIDVLNDVQHLFKLSLHMSHNFKNLQWAAKAPVGATGEFKKSILESFCEYASVSSARIEKHNTKDAYPGSGYVYEMLDLQKILVPHKRSKSLIEDYQRQWNGLGEIIGHSMFTTFIKCQAFACILPPYDRQDGGQLYELDRVPYGALIHNIHQKNPVNIHVLLAPQEALKSLWVRTQEGNYQIRPEIVDSAALLQYLRSYSPSPVFNVVDGVNIAGFHKAYPRYFPPYYTWERDIFATDAALPPDSAGHTPLSSTVPATFGFSSLELSAKVPPEFLQAIPALHRNVVNLFGNIISLDNTFSLCFARWIKGQVPTFNKGQPPHRYSMLESVYQWHAQRERGVKSPAYFPVFRVSSAFEQFYKTPLNIVIDTYNLTITTPSGKFELPKDGNGTNHLEQTIWDTLVNNHLLSDDRLILLPMDRQEVEGLSH